MEDTVTAEAVGFPARVGDVDVFAMLAGDCGVAEDALNTKSIMNTCKFRIAYDTPILLLFMLT